MILESPWFDACIGAVIFINAIAIGAEQALDLNGADITPFVVLEHTFLVIYVLELIVRFLATSGKCLSDNWVKFDLLFVGIGVICLWIVSPIVGDVDELESFYMLRLLRLLRLARAVRLIALFRDLWMLVQGMLVSAQTMVYTIGLIAAILYLFAVVSIEVITKNDLADPESGDPTFQSVVEKNFKDLPHAMLTLLQFVSFDIGRGGGMWLSSTSL
ncbi:unnamed protein product [Prorocentrum cordatum]|uniref:Ion transport domain-containing protein n=1 Tax=Prorocentrum cordatum TaxID=2364126 RepID=A0ABN9Q3C8_9DINO|nr:unnamed protein product [Polarella glacialis]